MNAVSISTPHAGRITLRPWQVSVNGDHIKVEAVAMAHTQYWLSIAHIKREGKKLLDVSDQSNPVLLRPTTEVHVGE